MSFNESSMIKLHQIVIRSTSSSVISSPVLRGAARVEIGLQIVVRRQFVPLATFLMQADPPALAFGMVVFDVHSHGRTARAKL